MKEIKRLFEVAIIIIKEVIAVFKGEHKKENEKNTNTKKHDEHENHKKHESKEHENE